MPTHTVPATIKALIGEKEGAHTTGDGSSSRFALISRSSVRRMYSPSPVSYKTKSFAHNAKVTLTPFPTGVKCASAPSGLLDWAWTPPTVPIAVFDARDARSVQGRSAE